VTEVQQSNPPVEVKLRSKKKAAIPSKKMQIKDKNGENGVTENGNDHHQEIQQNGNSIEGLALDTAALLHRTMESLYEINPELEDSHEGGGKEEEFWTKIWQI